MQNGAAAYTGTPFCTSESLLFGRSDALGRFWTLLDALGRSWVPSACSWVAFWALLGASWALLSALGVLLGAFLVPCWALLGASWALLGALGCSRGLWCLFGSRFGTLGVREEFLDRFWILCLYYFGPRYSFLCKTITKGPYF